MWTQAEAIELCREVEKISPDYGAHVALTGGCLYKDGPRKDCDLIFYRIRQAQIDWVGLSLALYMVVGINFNHEGKWCTKAKYKGKSVDIFWPESTVGVYTNGEE